MPFRAAAAQIAPALFDIEANRTKHLEWIERAKKADVDVLVFPELSLTGYLVGDRAYEIGLDSAHPLLEELASTAGNMYCVVGFVEEGFAAQVFCSAAVLHRGRVEFIHRKLNLANYGAMEEAKYFSQGRYVETTQICQPFTAALLLCADLWNPALVHLAAVNGATALIVPTNSSNDRSSGDFTKPAKWDLALRFYAMMYGLPIIFANRVGTEEGHEFWGGSRIVDARGEVIAKAEGDAEQLVIAELDYDQVRRARYELPTVRDSNLELLHREVNRLTSRIGVPDRFRHDKG